MTPNKTMSVRSCSMDAPVLTQRESLVRCFLAGGYDPSSHANAHQRPFAAAPQSPLGFAHRFTNIEEAALRHLVHIGPPRTRTSTVAFAAISSVRAAR